MSLELRNRILNALHALWIVDPHTHINPHAPASTSLADLLGYHYYTELAHSAGAPKSEIEHPELDPRTKVQRLVQYLRPLENTIQYSWLIEILRTYYGFEDELLTPENCEAAYESSLHQAAAPDWAEQVLHRSKLEALFLTNDFDDPLEGWDTSRYIPCLRTDDLVFHLRTPGVQERLRVASGVDVANRESLEQALHVLFERFKSRGARACAISLPPDFQPVLTTAGRADTAIENLIQFGLDAAESDQRAAAHYLFWTLAELCRQYQLPFDLMIGVNRGVYSAGVYQGRDLYDSRVSLIQYKQLFNAFPEVTFPVSVLASVTSQELASYAWIFPNVVTNGHWWYSNTPTLIEHDLSVRLEAVPCTKQIGYYSDMYKLEFALPKFNMYKRILAKVLAERYVIDRGWSEDRAIALGQTILKSNTARIFPG
ncbi:MAG: amidohydrolase [Planctomycetes bacterium]|nr:amidohydrolase [Planctomycetota bacterium]